MLEGHENDESAGGDGGGTEETNVGDERLTEAAAAEAVTEAAIGDSKDDGKVDSKKKKREKDKAERIAANQRLRGKKKHQLITH